MTEDKRKTQPKHSAFDLKQMQSLSLDAKIHMTKRRIEEWHEYWTENGNGCYVSFSGGKDSTVLKHLVDSMYNDVPSVFVDTGLEYPEIRKFVQEIRGGAYKEQGFNDFIEIVRPEMRFDEVVKEIGYPVISKENALYIRQCQNPTKNNEITRRLRLEGIRSDGAKVKIGEIPEKWKYLVNAPFKISETCCDIMKKKPAKQYGKQTGRKAIVGTMASESRQRRRVWAQYGCNGFEAKTPHSTPLAFWTEQDIYEYIVYYNLPIAKVYGDVVKNDKGKWETTGVDRTGW